MIRIIVYINIAILAFTLNVNGQESLSTSVQVEIETLAKTFLAQANTPGLSIAVSENGSNHLIKNSFGCKSYYSYGIRSFSI